MTSPPGYDASAYPPFGVTADVVVFTDDLRSVVLVERGSEPFKGSLALPGGFVEVDEDLVDAAMRELTEETGLVLRAGDLHELGAYGRPGRDPRMRVVSIVFWASVDDLDEPSGGSDAADAMLLAVADVLNGDDGLAFDHRVIIEDAVAAAESELRS